MLDFNVDMTALSPLENSSHALVVAVDEVMVAYRNMMEDWVDPAYASLSKETCFSAANRLRNIGVYQTSARLMLHSALVWVSIRSSDNPSLAQMLKESKAYVLIEDEVISSVGYKIIFMLEVDIMRAQILDTEGDELCTVATRM